MRRGHPGRGGWRNDGPRQFRPRTRPAPGFRSTRGYPPPMLNSPRFGPPGPHRFPPFGTPQPYNNSSMHQGGGPEQGPSDYNDPDIYHMLNRQITSRNSILIAGNQNPPFRPHDNMQDRHFNNQPDYFEQADQDDRYHTNSMGDVDQRTFLPPHRQETFPPPQHTPSWATRNRPRNYGCSQDITPPDANKAPSQEYSSHRPPASDHYEARPGIAVDNTETFSRTFDDTVNIIRKRLQNRNDPESQIDTTQNHEESEPMQQPPPETNQTPSAARVAFQRRKLRPKQSMNNNCDKIKTKIVHQLFKMDKERMHKLMDNPNSSSKFEYAINSLITESQNSYNKHVRSAAEKSLGGIGSSRNDDIQYNPNDTIYEDTFMRQMECILEPQDTIILEDIKPIVMAELNKVLQLSEYELTHDLTYDDPNYHDPRDQQNYDQDQQYNEYPDYTGECQDNPQYYGEPESTSDQFGNFDNPDSQSSENTVMKRANDDSSLFQRRPSSKTSEHRCRRRSRLESHHKRSESKDESSDRHSSRNATRAVTPLFDGNAEQFSGDEDPFADLDKQYHVAVDRSFIADDDLAVPKPAKTFPAALPETKPKIDKKVSSRRDRRSRSSIEIAADPSHSIEALEAHRNAILDDLEHEVGIKAELLMEATQTEILEGSLDPAKNITHNTEHSADVKKEKVSDPKRRDDSQTSSESLEKSVILASRKRSVDQHPSHRKEKRKKSDTSPVETNKQILNKNIIINVNDCAKTEKCEKSNTKSIFNLFFSKGDRGSDYKDTKNNEGADSGYSDKYVKRKESPQKPLKDRKKEESSHDMKRRVSTSSSSKDSSSHTNKSMQTPTTEKDKEDVRSKLKPIDIFPVKDEVKSKVKTELSDKEDSKAKLRSIDIFSDKPKKSSSTHQAVRNTAVKTEPTPEKVKTLPVKLSKQIVRKHVSIQVIRKLPSKCTQTIQDTASTKKMITRYVQTDPVSFDKPASTAKDSFERMKEIDMEIQFLLQEKFKLYNSLESKDAHQTVGMTVLKVSEDSKGEDEIIDEFTSIPEDELEALALESVEAMNAVTPKSKKKTQRKKLQELDRMGSISPKTTKKQKKIKTPNISLLEQIMDDERPLEEIISLDELETSPLKTRKKTKKKKSPMIPKIKIKLKAPPRIVRPKAVKLKRPITPPEYDIKECTVVLLREDLTRYLTKPKDTEKLAEEPQIPNAIVNEEATASSVVTPMVQDTMVQEFHFDQVDMLDVSEDIVIDSNCDFKLDDKSSESITVPVVDEIVLDNSQSSEDDAREAGASKKAETCKLYDFSADEDLRHDSVCVTGNADAVLAIECINNEFVAACLDGNVYHFSGEGTLLTTLKGSNLAVTCLTIVNETHGTTVYTGSLDSRIRYYDLKTGFEKGPECNVLSPIQTMDRAWDTVFVGTRTGFVLQFECKNNMLIPVSTIKFSDQSILALRALKEGPRKVLLVASRSESVTIKDAQTGLLLRTLDGPKKMTVYTLLYEEGKVYCGTSSNQIQVFDYSSGAHIHEHEGGKGAVCLRASGGLLFAGCYDGCVYVYRAGAARPAAQLRGGAQGVMLLSLAVHGSKIIAGYKDRSLYIWKIPEIILQEMVL